MLNPINAHKYTLPLSEEERLLFATIDYFSKNYPYSTIQIENFYKNAFVFTEANSGFTRSYEVEKSSNKHLYIQNIELTVKDQDIKLMSLFFKQPICLLPKEYGELLVGFELSYTSYFQTYSRILDEEKQIGKISLINRDNIIGVKDHIRIDNSIVNKEAASRKNITQEKKDNELCITNLLFSLQESSKPKRYSRSSGRQ